MASIRTESINTSLAREIQDKRSTRDDVANMYAVALRCSETDWPLVNSYILERWSLSALKYIKQRAWRSVKKCAV